MKKSQKLNVWFENYKVETTFEKLPAGLLPLAHKLEKEGDKYGPVSMFDGTMCIAMAYSDKSRDGIEESKIFGYPADALMAMQYK